MISKEYFSHDHNTRNKKKLGAIIHDHKMQGYGLFWVIVEMLHEDTDKWMSLDQVTFNSIAKESLCDVEFVKSFIKQCIEDYGVFIEKDEKFTTERVLRNTQHRLDIKEKRSKAGKASASVKQVLTRVEQKSTKKRKEKNSKSINTPIGVLGTDVPATQPKDELKKEYQILQTENSDKDRKVVFGQIKNFIEEKKPGFPEPYVDAWNIFAQTYGLEQVKQISGDRRDKIRIRTREPSFDFFKILGTIRQDSFYRGENQQQWKVDFNFIIKSEKNYIKLIEKFKEQ
jgi:hypothetical protein